VKLNCGPTREEKQRARERRQREQRYRLEEWHKWFAWFPVRVGKGDCRWLEVVERKGSDWSWRYDCHDTWDYRACR